MRLRAVNQGRQPTVREVAGEIGLNEVSVRGRRDFLRGGPNPSDLRRVRYDRSKAA